MANLLNPATLPKTQQTPANSKGVAREIGWNLLDYRRKSKMTQLELAKRCQIPRPTLTQIESGFSNPSLDILLKLCRGTGLTLMELTSSPPMPFKVIKSRSILLHSRSKNGFELRKLIPGVRGDLEFDEVLLPKGGFVKGAPHQAGSFELTYCTQGQLQLEFLQTNVIVEVGDLIHFPGSVPHSYRNIDKSETRFLSLLALGPLA